MRAWAPSSWAPGPAVPEVWTPNDDDAGPQTTVTVTFVGSDVYPIDVFHLRRGLVGGRLSRAWASVVQGGDRYVVSFRHEGSGADASAWEEQLDGADHAYADLDDGPVTDEDAAQAWADAMNGLGVTGISVDGAAVTIAGASDLLIGSPMTDDESLRGMWGNQRHDFGSEITANQNGNMGGIGSVHLATPGEGRILGAYIRAGGAANVRLGVADGPAYSTTPTQFSNVVEGIAENNSGLRVLLFAEPMAMAAAAHKWVLFKGAGGGNPTLNYRDHGEVVVGRGDLPVDERLIFDNTASDPAVAIGTGGNYTSAATSTHTIYSFVGFIYELEDDGSYPGDGSVASVYGKHGSATLPVTTEETQPVDMVDEVVGFRLALPAWDDGVIEGVELAITDWAADEDFAAGMTDMGDLVFPSATTNPTIERGDPMATTATGWNSHTWAAPIPFSAFADNPTVFFWAGERDSSEGLDVIAASFDRDTNNAGAWITRWVDDGRSWCDFVPAGGNGLGASAEYRTLRADGPLVAYGDPNELLPVSWTGAAGNDGPRNLLRCRLPISRPGITGTED